MPNMKLTQEQKEQLLKRVIAFENASGIQLVTTLLPRCDDYPEIPWKAFAAGVALSTSMLVLGVIFPDVRALRTLAALHTEIILMFVLGIGLLSASITIAWPAYARLFLSTARADGEVRQSAQALFLEHELFATGTRTGVLMLVAAFEHRVLVLADRNLRGKLPAGALDEVVHAMTETLRAGNWAAAFTGGIEKLEVLVRAQGFTGRSGNDMLPDHIDATQGEGKAC